MAVINTNSNVEVIPDEQIEEALSGQPVQVQTRDGGTTGVTPRQTGRKLDLGDASMSEYADKIATRDLGTRAQPRRIDLGDTSSSSPTTQQSQARPPRALDVGSTTAAGSPAPPSHLARTLDLGNASGLGTSGMPGNVEPPSDRGVRLLDLGGIEDLPTMTSREPAFSRKRRLDLHENLAESYAVAEVARASSRGAATGSVPSRAAVRAVDEAREAELKQKAVTVANETQSDTSTPTGRPGSIFNRPFGYNGKSREARTRHLSTRRPQSSIKAAKRQAADSFRRMGVGYRVYGKLIPLSSLDLREIGIGLQEIMAIANQNPEMINRLFYAATQETVDVASMSADKIADFVKQHNIYVGTFKPPNNRGQDVQRRKLVVLTTEQRGIYVHPFMAAMYTADFDGDDMEVSFDPSVAKLAKDPMAYMVGIDGKQSLNTDFLPVAPIVDGYSPGKTARDYVRETIFGAFANIDGRTIGPLVDAVLALSKTSNSDGDTQAVAWGEVFYEARRVADQVTHGRGSSDSMMSRLCNAVFSGMQELRVHGAISTIGETLDIADLPSPRTYDDSVIYRLVEGMVQGSVPNNFQELKVMLTGYLGNVPGKNAPFRFTADVGKMMKMDSRLQIGSEFVVDPNNREHMQMFFESTVKFVMSRKMAREIKSAGRSEYYMQELRSKVIKEVHFPDTLRDDGTPLYQTYAQFLTAFAASYNKNSSIINESNLSWLTSMEISSNSNRGLVSPLNPSRGGLTINDLAEPLLSVYGTYSVGKMFDGLTKSGVMGKQTDTLWSGNPNRPSKSANRPVEREYDYMGEARFWVTGKYVDFNLRQFVIENRLIRGDTGMDDVRDKHGNVVKRGIRNTLVSSLSSMSDVDAQFRMLLAIADKRTSTASAFCTNVYGAVDKEHQSDENTTVRRISDLVSELDRLDSQGEVIKPGYYAGIGSRETPPEVQASMTNVAKRLANLGWMMRSGHAEGADQAFEAGAGKDALIYLPKKGWNGAALAGGTLVDFDMISDADRRAAEDSVIRYHPKGSNLDKSEFAFMAHRRNYLQIAGTDGSPESAFVACWTPVGDGKSHGTDQAIRIAKARGIPVFNAAEYDDLSKWEEDVINAAIKAKSGELWKPSYRDQMLWVNDVIETLVASGPDMFFHFNMDSTAGFLKSTWARKMVEHAGDIEVLGGIRTAMVFDYRMDRVTKLQAEIPNPLSDVDRYMDACDAAKLARDELAASSEVWRGIFKEFEAEESANMSSVFQMMRNGAMVQTAVGGRKYVWYAPGDQSSVELDAKKFWRDPGDHQTLRSVIEDLDMDRSTKWAVIADVVRYWEQDAYLKSYEVGYQLEVGCDASYSLGSSSPKSALGIHRDFEQAFNRWGKVSQQNLQKEVNDAAERHRDKPGRLMHTLQRLDSSPWELVSISDETYADSILSVYDKSYAQTEKASQHPWTNAVYAGLSFQRNDGYMNDVTRTDDRLLGIQSVDSVGIQDVVHLLADPDATLEVYNQYGEIGILTRESLLQNSLERLSGDVEQDIWQFLLQEPRIASAIRRHSACVIADADGTGYLGARLSTRETIDSMIGDSSSDPIAHVKYLMRDHPVYAGIISMVNPARGAVTRTARHRIMRTENYLASLIYELASSDALSSQAASMILEDIGIVDEKSIARVLKSNYDVYLSALGLPVSSEQGGFDNGEVMQDAHYIYDTVLGHMTKYVDEVRANVQLGMPIRTTSGSNAITGFRGDNAFLSNFYDSPVTIDGITYKNAEAAFQAQKSTDPAVRMKFANLSGSDARKLGKNIELRDDWDSVREDVMRLVIKAKFSNPKMRKMLEATGDAELVESNTWGDTFWGVSNGFGRNMLGEILMEQRGIMPSIHRPRWLGIDAESVASFWDVVQELSGAKTFVSTSVEGAETYQFAEWASHVRAKDRYADLEAVADDVDESWDGMWTNVVDADGISMVIRVNEGGSNVDDIIDAAKAQKVKEIVTMVPVGYDVRDRSTDSHGNPVPSLFAYMVSKRSNGAEANNLKAKKSGIDGKDSVTKMQGKYRTIKDPSTHQMRRASFLETQDELRRIAQQATGSDEYDPDGMIAAKLRLAQMMLDENLEFGYDDLTLANYMSIADLMLIRGLDGQIYLRSLEMLFSAVKYRIGAKIDEMSEAERTEAINSIINDNSDNGVGMVHMFSPLECLDGISPKATSNSPSGIRPASSVFARNYDLLDAIAKDAAVDGVMPMSQARAEQLNDRYVDREHGIKGVAGVVNRSDILRGYSIVGYAGAYGGDEKINWTVGPSRMVVVGDGEVSDSRVAEICDRAYSLGVTVVVSASNRDKIPNEYRRSAVPCSLYGDVLIPCFDMRLNGSEAKPSIGRFAIFQAPFSRYVVSVEDSMNEFMLGDAEAKPTKAFVDRIKVVDNGSVKIKTEDLFPNVFKNPEFRHSTTRASFASGDEIASLIARGVRCTIDYGVVEGGHGSEQRKHDVDKAIGRYRSRWSQADPDGIMRGGMTECAPGDIVGWAKLAIRDEFTNQEQYVLAPIIPFPLHGSTRNIPERFTVEQLVTVDDDNTIFAVDWSNTSSIENSNAKYFDSSGGANKGMMNFAKTIVDNQRLLRDGSPVDVYIAKASTDSRKIGTDRRIKTMISLMALARMHGYNFATSEGAFPSDPAYPKNDEIRERLQHRRISTGEWKGLLVNNEILFTYDQTLNAFLNYECRKVLDNGGNPSDYLANTFTDAEGVERNSHVMWEFEAMFEQGLNYESGLLRFLHTMDPTFCPKDVNDMSESYLFRLYRDASGSASGYDCGVLQMQVPYRSSKGTLSYLWDNVYIGMSFFGEDYSGFSRPNVNGASNFLDAMNTMSYYGAELDEKSARYRAMWATADIGRIPHDGGALGKA